ncbi:MAG TPA: hypothetical protein VJP77_05600 [Planctomycetota bacterium]|nr:hypothetical protein [Planctomycetota bacterium]
MTVTVATLRESILAAIRAAVPSYNVHGGTPYGVDLRADDQSLFTAGKLRAVFVGEASPDAVHRVGGTHDLSARVRVEMYREAEADLDAGSWPSFNEEVASIAVAVNSLANCEAVATVAVSPRSPFLRRFCHRAELVARFFKLCTEEA